MISAWMKPLIDEANRRAFDYPRDAKMQVYADMVDEAAASIAVELQQDGDPFSLQRLTTRLALLHAWSARGFR